jgi:uncharacterized spore protein YtfJ
MEAAVQPVAALVLEGKKVHLLPVQGSDTPVQSVIRCQLVYY